MAKERQDDVKPVLYFGRWSLYFPSKREYNFSIVWILLVSCSAMIVMLDVSYSNSGGDGLCLVPGAYRCSVVVVDCYKHYFPSSRNALYVVRDAHRCNVMVEVIQFPFFPKQKIPRRC